MITFEIKSEKKWLKIWDALNDTAIPFTAYAYKCITVFNEKDAEKLRTEMKENKIAFAEV